VTTIAINIPIEAKRLPFLAVFGEPRNLMPKMKKIEATR
jgi:hypothetical protein